MPGARGQLDDREPAPLELVAQDAAQLGVIARRLGAVERHEPERLDEPSQRSTSGARASTVSVTRSGITFAAPGSTSTRPTVATAPSISRAISRMRRIRAAAFTSASSRASIGIVPA